MTAHELVAKLLEDAPTERSKAVVFHPSRISDSGFYVSGDGKHGAVVKVVGRLFNVKVEGERAVEALKSMIENGYSVVVRNAIGGVTVYSPNKVLRLPGKTMRQLADYMGISSMEDKVKYTSNVELKGTRYKTKQFRDVFQSTTPDEDEVNRKRRRDGQTAPERSPDDPEPKREGTATQIYKQMFRPTVYEPER